MELENMPDESKIWIYQANRKFTDEEVAELGQLLSAFTARWSSHGAPLDAAWAIKYSRFIILAVNQEQQPASGCSVDDSVHFIQELEQKFQVDLLDKMNVTYRLGEHIAHKPLTDFKKMAKDKAVSPQTIVFNNLVNTVGEWKDYWEVPARDSWHSRFF